MSHRAVDHMPMPRDGLPLQPLESGYGNSLSAQPGPTAFLTAHTRGHALRVPPSLSRAAPLLGGQLQQSAGGFCLFVIL